MNDEPEDENPPPEPPAQESPQEPPQEPPKRRGLFTRLVLWALVLTVVLPAGCTAVYHLIPPPVTILMLQRLGEGRGLARDWVAMKDISPSLAYAVVAAEDARFCEHRGFDFEAMRKALAHNERRPGRIRGGSTISQQTAKNVFLWPDRSYLRKGLEAYFTLLIEGLWGKRRIMEVYLNTVEWGPGVYGAQAAARTHFGVDAADLTATQAARLAAILPSPLKWRAANPGPYVRGRSRRIAAAAGTVRQAGLAACLGLAGAPRLPVRPEARRKAAEAVMEQTAPPPEPEAPPPSDEALPPIDVAPEPLALPPVQETAPPTNEEPPTTAE